MAKMKGVYLKHCEVVRCKKIYKTDRGFAVHMNPRHPQAGPPLIGRDYSSQIKEDMDIMSDIEDLLDMPPKDEADLFANNDTITFDLNGPHDLPDPLIQVATDPLYQDDPPLSQDLTALHRVQSTGDMASFVRNAQALLTVATSVPACSEVSSFFLQNPTKQSSMDLTASQKIPLVPLLEESSDESESEEEKIEDNESVEGRMELCEYEKENIELNPFYLEVT
jgi:hypothetical protein